MAHEIDTTFTATGAAIFAREPAWHGLGVVTPEAFTSAEALAVAGIDFTVECHPTFAKVGDVFVPFPARQTTVRMDLVKPLGVVGQDYCPMQTRDLFKAFDEVLADFGGAYEAAGVLREGARVWILARLPETHKVTDAPGDEIAEYLLMLTSHDGTSATWCLPTPTRVVCANTLAMATGGEGFGRARRLRSEGKALRILHTANASERLKAAREMFASAHDGVLALVQKAKELADIPATPDMREATILHTIDTFVGSDWVIQADGTPRKVKGRESKILKTRTEINALIEAEIRLVGENAWALYNAGAEYADHGLKYRGENAAENRFESVTGGRAAQYKEALVPVLVRAMNNAA